MRTNGLLSHSAATVVGSLWPGWRRVSGGRVISRSMIEFFRSSNPVAPGAMVPPTVPLKITSAVMTSVPSIEIAWCPAAWPGVKIASISSSPDWSLSPSPSMMSTGNSTFSAVIGWAATGTPRSLASSPMPTTWSQWSCVTMMWVRSVPSRSTRSSSGSITPLLSTRTPLPPGRSITR